MQTEQYSARSGRRMQDTQLAAHEALTVRVLTARQAAVMDCFPGPIVIFTREDIAANTGLRLSSVCGRVRELLDAGRLEVRGRRYVIESKREQQLLGLPVKTGA